MELQTSAGRAAPFVERRWRARDEMAVEQLDRLARLPLSDPEREYLRAKVIEDHMPYARYIARRYARSTGMSEDLEQVAYLGLVKAVDNFDPDRGTAFIGYATPMIIGEIKRHFRDTTWDVHVPRRLRELTGTLLRARERLTADLGRSPSVGELAEQVGADESEVIEALDASSAYYAFSLDRPLGNKPDSVALVEVIGNDDPAFASVVDRVVLKKLIGDLGERDKKILLLRFFRGMTQAQIAGEIGLSQMHVSRLIARILANLREGFG